MASDWTVSVSGRTELMHRERGRVSLRPKERAVIAALAVAGRRGADLSTIIEDVWGDDPPATARASLRNHLTRIRAAAPGVVTSTEERYRLSNSVRVAPPAPTDTEPAYAELWQTEVVNAARRQHDEARRVARRRHADALIGDGRHREASESLTHWLAAEPDDLDLRRSLVRSLAAESRIGDALAVVAGGQRRRATAGLPPDVQLNDLARMVTDGGPALPVLATATGVAPAQLIDHGRIGLDGVIDQIIAARSEGRRLVVIRGPAGSGKSTLLDAVVDRLRGEGAPCVATVCRSHPHLPLEPIVDLIEQTVERRPDALDALPGRAALRQLMGDSDEPVTATAPHPRAARDSVAAGASLAIAALGQQAVVAIDDLHWATPMSARAVADIAASTEPAPFCLVTTRSNFHVEAGDEPVVIDMKPWTVETIAAYLALFTDDENWIGVATTWLHTQSGGSPLFVRELLEAVMRERGLRTPFVPPRESSPTLTAQLRRSIAELPDITRLDLAAAAILGRRFRLADFEIVAVTPATSLSSLIDTGLVRPIDEVTAELRHDVIREVVLDDLAPGRRIELHDAAFAAIADSVTPDSNERIDELALHALGTASIDPARAIAIGRRALDRYAAEIDLESAAELARRLDEIIESLGAASTRAGLEASIRLGRLLRDLGNPEATERLIGAAERSLEARDQLSVADALVELCRLGPLSLAGEVDETGRRLVAEAAAIVTDPEPTVRLAVAGIMLNTHGGDVAEVRRWFDRGLEASSSREVPEFWVGMLLSRGTMVLSEPDEIEERRTIQRRLAAQAERTGRLDERWAATDMAMSTAVMVGHRRDMHRHLDELGALADQIAEVQRRWELLNWRAAVATVDGRYDDAERFAGDAAGFGHEIAPSLVMAAHGAHLVAIRRAQGRLGELAPLVAPIVEAGTTIGAWHAVLAAAAAETEREVATERLAAITADDDCSLLARDPLRSAGLVLAADAALALDDAEAGARVLSCLEPWRGLWAFAETCTLGPIDPVLDALAILAGSSGRRRR